ncbi:geminin isoform X2 [Solenopsis invicta]|uniref:geminin isoform X2 n=1 Tax=Solenopsis invicta TaxID=13686 RepID=UPI000E33EE8F|nr:geminin isoform X2 [Solenopsis invicta]
MMEPVKTDTHKTKDRKPLHELQPAATDKEILVGADRILQSTKSKETKIKQHMTENIIKDVSKYKKVTKKNKAVQTVPEKKITIEAEDLTLDNPSENYWQIIAERTQIALVNALEENKKLVQDIEKLQEENRIYKEMLDETKVLIEVLQEQIEDDRNDVNNSLGDSFLI